MESKPEAPQKEEIYCCKKCDYPLSSSLSIRTTQNNYDDIIKSSNTDLDPNNYKLIFIYFSEELEDRISHDKFNFIIDIKRKKIFCRNDNEKIGFIRTVENDLIGDKLTFGYLNIKNINTTEVEFKFKKEIPVYSQEQYTALAKLKQIRYYVKQITPTLKSSMDLVKEEKNNVYNCEDKFEKYKLNLVLNRYKAMQKELNIEENENKNDK